MDILLIIAALAVGGALGYFLGYSRGAAIARLPPLDHEPLRMVKRPVGPRKDSY